MKIGRRFSKKLLASLLNVALVLGVFIVLFPLFTPPVKAAIYYFQTDWVINDVQSYTDDTFILYGDLFIRDNGSLTLNNCTIKMALGSPDPGHNITVESDGTFNLLNNSLITTNSTDPDPYEFRIDGKALIENSTVEKMKDRALDDEDGIQIYSDDVIIANSTVQNGYGTGIYVEDSSIKITNSSIINNNLRCTPVYGQ